MKLDTSYISSFCMELYLIMQAGIPLDEGVGILGEGEPDAHIRQSLSDVRTMLWEGKPLNVALTQSQVFPQYMVDMIAVGEETGNLDRSLKALSDYYNRQEQLERNLRRAVLYPVVLLAMLTAVMAILIVEVLPMFSDVYAQLGGTMSGLGAGMLQMGLVVKSNWVTTLVVLALAVATGVMWAIRGRRNGERVLLSKKLGLAVATAKLASSLAMALQSGLDLDLSMDMAERLTQHPGLKGKLAQCRQQMETGEGFATAVSQAALFSSLHCRMLGVGVRTGSMDQVMEDIAQRCDSSAQESIDQYIGNVEPTLVVIMSVLVGAVLLSVMLPLASIMSSLG